MLMMMTSYYQIEDDVIKAFVNLKRFLPIVLLVKPRYPPQFLNNQSDRGSIVKRQGQKFYCCSTSCYNWLRPMFRLVGVEVNGLKENISTDIQYK